jgi:predicted ATPase/class 3 adenylate cyclase
VRSPIGSPSRGVAEHPARPGRPNESTRADRRTVTVLFADLSGFTAISERLDPEVVQSLQNEIFAEMTVAAESFGGFVDKFIGDAMLALFGAPAAHEDDPERALRASLDMIDRIARASERSRAVLGAPLKLHIGINTGPVVAGGIGAGSARSYSVTGDTVNTAQRLQSMAQPGEVLVGPATCALTRHAFRFEPLGEASIRGRAGGLVVHRLAGPLETPRPARGLETLGLSAPLVGRSAELVRMIDHLDRASGGEAQLLRLVGEAGIGKTRLVNEFLASIRDDKRFAGVAIRRVACSPLGEPSYGALGALLRAAYGIDFNASAAQTESRLVEALVELGLSTEEIHALTPFYLHVLGIGDSNPALQHVEPIQLRRQIFFAVRTIFERRVALSPCLIVVEDLHWADAVSLEALRFVLDRLERARLMVVVTHRPMAEIDPFASSRVSQTALRLAALDDAQCRTLLASYFGEDCVRASNALCRRILERSSGNPLFIEEILRSLIEMDVLRREGPHWRVVAGEASIDIPASIHALLLARMDRLPHEVRALAQEAAVIGPRFEVVLLKAIAASPAAVDSGLDVLTDAEVIEEVGSTRPISQRAYRFRQSLLHDAIYQNLLVQRRSEMHGLIGTALERLCGPNPERLEDAAMLGHHFSLSAMKVKGAQYLRAAGDRASAIYANDDALRLYRQALDVVAASGGQTEESLLLRERIADLCGRSGRRDEARDMYQAALEAHRASGERAAAARILRKLGALAWDGGKRNQAEEHYAEAARLLEGTNAPVEEAHLFQERGRIAFRLGDHVAAVKWAEDALDRVRSAPDGGDDAGRSEAARAAAEALNTKGVALARLGRSREALREVERSVAGAEAAGLLGAACRGYTNLGVLYTIIDPKRAIEICQRGLETARRIGDLGFEARLLANLAVACCTFTDRCADEGVPAAEKAIELDRALDQREHLPAPLIALGHIHQCHGQPELADRYYREALEVADETGDPQHLFPCYDGLATLSLDRGDMVEAERYFAQAQEVCARHGLNPDSLIVLPFLD